MVNQVTTMIHASKCAVSQRKGSREFNGWHKPVIRQLSDKSDKCHSGCRAYSYDPTMMLLMGMWINLMKKPRNPMQRNPTDVATAIFLNSANMMVRTAPSICTIQQQDTTPRHSDQAHSTGIQRDSGPAGSDLWHRAWCTCESAERSPWQTGGWDPEPGPSHCPSRSGRWWPW